MNNIRLSLSIAGGMCSVLKLHQSVQTEHAGDRATISGAFLKSVIIENTFLKLEKTFALLGYKTSFSFAQNTLSYLPFFLAYQIYCQEKSKEKNRLWLKALTLSQDLMSPLYHVTSAMQALAFIYSGAYFAGGLAIGILALHYLAEIYLDSAFMHRIGKTYRVFLRSLGLFSSRWKIQLLSLLTLSGVAHQALIKKPSSPQTLAVPNPANKISSKKQLNQILNSCWCSIDPAHFLKVNREYVHFPGLPEPSEDIQLDQLTTLLEEQIENNREDLLTEFNFVASNDEKFNQENIYLESDEEKIQFLKSQAKCCIELIQTRDIQAGKLEKNSYLFLSKCIRLCLAEFKTRNQKDLAYPLVYLIFNLRYCGPGQVEVAEQLAGLNILAAGSDSIPLRFKLLNLLKKDREKLLTSHPYLNRIPDLQNLHINNQLASLLNLGIRPEAVASDVEAQETAGSLYLLLWPIYQLIRYAFWRTHTPNYIIERIQNQTGTQNFTHEEVKNWWKDWANVLPENEKHEFINKIDEYKIGSTWLVDRNNRIAEPVIAAMLVAMGILELNPDTSANGES